MTSIAIKADCQFCKHWREGEVMREGRLVCRAFTSGIPDKIILGEVKHTEQYKGDNGIRFEDDRKDK